MDLEVVGRHALLFDDDATAAFINTSDALVEWNSLSIDRYDVRHLLSSPPPPRKLRRHHRSEDPSLDSELDRERYLDLPSPSDEDQEQDLQDGTKLVVAGGYNAVAFSYGNTDEAIEQKNNDAESGFRPPFQVPESLLQNLPPTEKIHQIIARTAMFVSKHGGQSEIVLRVKQGDNPTFGFLMPDHHLHAYFRFLVDHQELLKPDSGDKSLVEKNNTGLDQAGSALSILGSVYGSGEDEDGATEEIPEYKRNELEEAVNAGNVTVSDGSVQAVSSVNVAGKDVAIAKSSVMSLKEKAPIIKRNRSISTVMVGTRSGVRKEADALGSLCTAGDKSQASLLSTPKVEQPIVEPPSDLKRVVDKIVEFILKNGKQFEAVLVEQDQKHGRFPFLLSSNQYYPYYLKALEKAKELKLPGKGSDSMGHQVEKKTAVPKEGDTLSRGSSDLDIPYSYDRKEKFKMFIGKSKKDGQDPPSKATEPQIGISMDAASAAAILQAATRGIKNPSLENFPKTSLNGIGRGPSSDGGHTSSFGSLRSSQPQSSISKPDQKGEPSVSVPVAKAIAETAAIAAASEADSSEACLTREQKLKAERLKRAKMFAVMIKSGAAPLKTEPLRGLSAEPLGSGISGSGTEVENFVGKEREGSSVPIDVDDKIEKSEKKISVDEYNERRSKRSYRSRSKRHEEQEEGEVEEDKEEEIEEEQEGEDKRAHKHTRKKHRSHRSSHHSRERHKHRKRHSSKDRDSRHRRKYDDSSDDEHQYSRHQDEHDTPSNKEHRHSQHRRHRDERDSSDDEYQHSRDRDEDDTLSNNDHQRSQHRRKHDSSSDDQHRHSRRRKHHSSDDEHEHRSRSVRHRKSQSDKEMDLEEGEIVTKSDQSKASQGDVASREASVELSKSYQDGGAPSQPSEPTEISDDLRAKIRAMLMATLNLLMAFPNTQVVHAYREANQCADALAKMGATSLTSFAVFWTPPPVVDGIIAHDRANGFCNRLVCL